MCRVVGGCSGTSASAVAVLKQAADMSGYGKKMPKGRGMGISVHRSFVSYVACAMEVEVSDAGDLKVHHAWMAIDCGVAVNPDRVKAQMEGAVVFALSHALHGEITFENGAVVQSNFDTYPVCRIDEAPHVEVAIMPSDSVPGGVGEPGVPPVAAALANAIFAATGKRIRRHTRRRRYCHRTNCRSDRRRNSRTSRKLDIRLARLPLFRFRQHACDALSK